MKGQGNDGDRRKCENEKGHYAQACCFDAKSCVAQDLTRVTCLVPQRDDDAAVRVT